ncbi:substrate-binding domain-containing protein [Amycolatopsis sp. NPDC023774]|uniref:substrate-binding domain-containing protein n=1 Tax=Amycolatopsis sp. NPDC023774 TaxID=3155015 RepID=UPI00340D2AF9
MAAGHTRITLAYDDGDVNSTWEYTRGCRQALAAHGLEPAAEIRLPDTPEGGGLLAERLLAMAPAPAAVMLAQETLAVGLYRRFAEAAVCGRARTWPWWDPQEPGVRLPRAVADHVRGFAGSVRAAARRDRARPRRLGEGPGAGGLADDDLPGDSDTAPPRVAERLG